MRLKGAMSNLTPHINTKPGLLTRLMPWVLLCSVGIATEIIHLHIQQQDQQRQLTLVESYTRELAMVLEHELNASVLVTRGLGNYIVSTSGQLDGNIIEPWLTPFVNNDKHFRNIAIAPDNTVTYVYPLTNNENVIGLHYPRNPSQWPEIEIIILSRKPMLAGPVSLVQGGQGLVYRFPIYIDRHYWGLLSTVIDADSLFSEVQQRADQMGIQVALIDGRANRKFWRLVWGQAALMESATNSIKLDIPGRNWQLLAQHENTNLLHQNWIRVSGWSLALMLSLTIYSVHRAPKKNPQRPKY
jgi:sensor domain CHASE-containing protein